MILFQRIKSKKFFWISIEGTDGVGKTTLVKKLYNYLRNRYKNKVFILINEFSTSKIGELIKDIICQKNFFMLGSNRYYPISETLILYADFIYQFEKINLNKNLKRKIYIISDRGPYSFLTYQLSRLKTQYRRGSQWKNWINKCLISLGYPDFSVCLVSNIQEIKQRLIKRGDKIKKPNVKFIQKVQREYINLFKSKPKSSNLIVKNKDGEIEKVFKIITESIKPYIK